MYRLILLSVFCVSICLVYSGKLEEYGLNNLPCDFRQPNFEECQAKFFKAECAKRENEAYRRCTECEPTCAVPNPTVCILSCTPGCVCKEGYFRNELKKCVRPFECSKYA